MQSKVLDLFEKEPGKFAVRSSAYRGGLSRIEDGETVYYEFLADAHTGTVLEISRKRCNRLIRQKVRERYAPTIQKRGIMSFFVVGGLDRAFQTYIPVFSF